MKTSIENKKLNDAAREYGETWLDDDIAGAWAPAEGGFYAGAAWAKGEMINKFERLLKSKVSKYLHHWKRDGSANQRVINGAKLKVLKDLLNEVNQFSEDQSQEG